MSQFVNLNKINYKVLYYVYYKTIDLFSEYGIGKYIDNNKKQIMDNLYSYFDNNDESIKSLNIINMKNIFVNYIKVKQINQDQNLCFLYKKNDLTVIFDNYTKNIINGKKIYNKNDLFDNFKSVLLNLIKIQDPSYTFNETIIENDITINFSDIKDKIYSYIYMEDIDKFIDIYLCNNPCECTEQMLCNTRNEIIDIMCKTITYNPCNIIYNDLQNINFEYNIDENEILNKIQTFLSSSNFDIYNLNKTFNQIFIPPQ